jgi:hypothetical protein
MKSVVRADSIEQISRTAMINHFTVDEINALTDFYGSKNGVSIMKKFSLYMAEVAPALEAEIQRGLQKLQAEEQAAKDAPQPAPQQSGSQAK